MPAHPKIIGARERRLLAILRLGESLEAATRAVGVSSWAVRKKARRDPVFALHLQAARQRREPQLFPLAWQEAAERLERLDPERWKLPEVDDYDAWDVTP